MSKSKATKGSLHPYQGVPSVGYLSHWASRLLSRLLDNELRPLGVTSAQLSPLLIMEREGPILQRDLVKQSAIAQPAMVTSLAILEKGGFVKRRPHSTDRRAHLFEITERGRSVVTLAVPILTRANERALKGLSASEKNEVVRLMQRVVQNLEDSL